MHSTVRPPGGGGSSICDAESPFELELGREGGQGDPNRCYLKMIAKSDYFGASDVGAKKGGGGGGGGQGQGVGSGLGILLERHWH